MVPRVVEGVGGTARLRITDESGSHCGVAEKGLRDARRNASTKRLEEHTGNRSALLLSTRVTRLTSARHLSRDVGRFATSHAALVPSEASGHKTWAIHPLPPSDHLQATRIGSPSRIEEATNLPVMIARSASGGE
jgi:hypothetical protein